MRSFCVTRWFVAKPDFRSFSVSEAQHLPARQRLGYGKLDDDLTFFVCLKVRIEEGGFVEVCAGFYLDRSAAVRLSLYCPLYLGFDHLLQFLLFASSISATQPSGERGFHIKLPLLCSYSTALPLDLYTSRHDRHVVVVECISEPVKRIKINAFRRTGISTDSMCYVDGQHSMIKSVGTLPLQSCVLELKKLAYQL